MQSIRRILVASMMAALIISPFAVAPVAGAQSNDESSRESITLSPTSKQYAVDAGNSLTGELTVVNDGTKDFEFIVYARPYSIVNNDYNNPNFTQVTKYSDLYGWVQFPQTRYSIEAGKTLKIPYKVNVPEGAAPGGHYGVIFAETQPTGEATSGNSVVRKKRVGSIVYATVNGDYRNEGQALGFEIPFWQFEPPLHTTATAKNTGNTNFATTTKLTVRDVFGNKKYEATKDYQVLPDTTRVIPLEWAQSSWFGFYKVEVSQRFLDTTEQSDAYVLMMPRYMPIALLVIVVLGGVFYARSRRRKR